MDSTILTYILAILVVCLGGFYAITREIKKRSAQALIAREKHFRGLVDASLHPLILKNEKGKVVFASDSIKTFLGLEKNIPKGKLLSDYIHPEDKAHHNVFLSSVLAQPHEKKTIEVRMKKGEEKDEPIWTWVRIAAINLLDHDDIKAVVSTLQDITFQKQIDKEKADIIMQEKNARGLAEKAVKDRDEFLAIASHELKTPLTTVLLQLQSTLRKISTQSLTDFSGADLLNSLQIAENQSQRLSVLIKDLLNISLASAGKISLNRERVSLAELTQNLIRKYEEEIRLSGNKVVLDIKSQKVVGQWDPIRIEQAISNLLMNALKYSGKKTVRVIVNKNGNWATVHVKDKGQGIPEKYHELIFEPFKRANSDKNAEGLGVGLFIARQIATAHSGDLKVESEPGKGSTFTLRLPM